MIPFAEFRQFKGREFKNNKAPFKLRSLQWAQIWGRLIKMFWKEALIGCQSSKVVILCYLPPIRLIILLSNVREAAALTSDSATSSKGLWFLWLHMLFFILIWDKSGVYFIVILNGGPGGGGSQIRGGVLIWRGALIRALTYCNCESYKDRRLGRC